MSKSKGIQFLEIAIIVFQIVFIFQIIFTYNIFVAANPFTNQITEESWLWYNESMKNVSNEMLVLGIAGLSKILFQVTFLLGIINILTNKNYSDVIGKKKIILYLVASIVLYGSVCWTVDFLDAHYRLYMNSISVEILTLLLWAYIWEINKSVMRYS